MLQWCRRSVLVYVRSNRCDVLGPFAIFWVVVEPSNLHDVLCPCLQLSRGEVEGTFPDVLCQPHSVSIFISKLFPWHLDTSCSASLWCMDTPHLEVIYGSYALALVICCYHRGFRKSVVVFFLCALAEY